MRTKTIIVLFAVLALILPVAAVMAQGGEPIEPTDTREGNLTDSQATYSLALEAGQSVTITLDSDDFDAYLQVQDESGVVLIQDDDSGGNLNSALLFAAPATGTYTVVVSAFGGQDASGSYVLSTSVAEVTELTYGSSAKVLFDGTQGVYYYTFTGKEGDVINLYADNGELDTRLTVYGPDGTEIAYDDDGGEGLAPSIRRLMLLASGSYNVELATFSEDETGVTQLLLEQTELLMLDAGMQTAEFNQDFTSERYGITLTEGMSYRVTLTTDVSASGSVEIMFDPEAYDYTSVSFNNTTEATMAFTSTVSGVVSVEVIDYTWASDTVNYQISVTPLQ